MTAPLPVRPPDPPGEPAPTLSRTPAEAVPETPSGAPEQRRPSRLLAPLRETGKLFALGLAVARAIFRRPFQLREFIEQFWFVASVTILPAALVSIPFGAVIALQVGSLTQQLGAQSFTGGASV
ncbi:ABC transporter permease, partial [Streptomyces cavourensis]|nr:ABC transporter permease [Streptomyces cavourensis]